MQTADAVGGSESSSASEPAPDRRQGGATSGGSPRLLRSNSGDCLASQGWKSRRRHTAWWQLGQQVGRGLGNSANGRFEGKLGGGRGGLHPTDLPNVLTSCRFNLLSGRCRLQPPERGDVSTHGARIGRGGRFSLKCFFGVRNAEHGLGPRSSEHLRWRQRRPDSAAPSLAVRETVGLGIHAISGRFTQTRTKWDLRLLKTGDGRLTMALRRGAGERSSDVCSDRKSVV